MVGSFKKRMGQWLGQSEENVNVGFSKSFPVALVILDQKLNVVTFTRKWKEDFNLAGIDDEDLVGRPIDSILSAIPLYQPEWMRIIKHALKGEATFKEHDIFRYDDKRFDWLNWAAKPWRPSGSSIDGVVISSQTITRHLELEKYYELSTSLLCTADIKGFFLDVNEAFTKVLGHSKEYLLERSFYDYIHPDDIEKTAEAIKQLEERNKVEGFENRMRREDGSYIDLQWAATKEYGAEIFYAIAEDISTGKSHGVITDRNKELLDGLIDLQEMYIKGVNVKQLFSSTLQKLFSLTGSTIGFIAAVSQDEDGNKFLILLGISEMDWDEDTLKFYEQYSKGFVEIHDLENVFGKTISQQKPIVENSALENEEIVLPIGFDCKSYLGLPLTTEDGVVGMIALMNNEEGYNGNTVEFISPFVRSIASIVQLQGGLVDVKHMSCYDKLTSLYSKSFFEEKLAEVLEAKKSVGEKFGLIYIDLNRFKAINDTYGHLVGDDLLEKVAKRILGASLKTDIVARVGGDRFGIIIQENERVPEILRVCKKIRLVLVRPYDIQGVSLEIEGSIGIAVFPDSGDSVVELERHANFALHEAKKIKGNVEIYSEAVEEVYQERLLIENNLETAFSNDEFKLEYQPQVDVLQSKLIGVEVLIRWNHPQLGMLAPDKFIPIIEEMGKAEKLNLWLVKQISKEISLFPEYFKNEITISFNFSPVVYNLQEHMTKLKESVSNVLKEYRIQAEITEKEIWDPRFNIVEFSKVLEELEITLSIDDFGKSYSSLRRLVELPVKTIKIDMGFVHNIDKDEKTEKVVVSIINLAHSLKMDVIAEGVETKEQLDRLKEHGCNLMQGNYFYKPMPINVFQRIFTKK